MRRMDAREVKQHAHGRWRDIILALCSKAQAEHLDGRHHSCPECGGKDRFRVFPDFDQKGGCICGQCHDKENGDGLSTIMWLNNVPTLPKAIDLVAEYLGLQQSNGSTKTRESVMESVARRKNITIQAMEVYGAHKAVRYNRPVVRFPMYDGKGNPCSHFDIGIPKGSKDEDKLGNKGLNDGGRKAGVFLPGRSPVPDETWVVGEGVKDACALHSLGYNALGLPGKVMDAKFAELLRGCHVILVHDLDSGALRESLKNAAKLYGIAASVKTARLPGEIKESEGEDVRDVLRRPGGESLVRETIDRATEWKPPEDKEKSFAQAVAEKIEESNHFARDPGNGLYRFVDGAYRSRAEKYVKDRVREICEGGFRQKQWSPNAAEAVIQWIVAGAPELWEKPPTDVVNVKNGLLHIETRELLPHSPEHLSVVQLPITYDPDATCPAIDKFVSEVFPEDAVPLAYEVPGYLMSPNTSIQKAVLLQGPGGNGKSVYLSMVKAFLGKRNVSSASLHYLESSRFAPARLYGKLANICADLPEKELAGTSIFKQITGGDFLTSEVKFKMAFEFLPFSRLVFSCNPLPRSSDGSEGFFQRWIVVPFERSFRGEANEIPKDELDARLSDRKELSGLLNRALDGLDAIRERNWKFHPCASTDEAHREFQATTDPLAVWLDRYTIDDPESVVPCDLLRATYNGHRDRGGEPSVTKKDFGTRLKRARPRIKPLQRMVSGSLKWCYVGIGLLGDHGDSQDSREPAHLSSFTPPRDLSRGFEEEELEVEVDRSVKRSVNLVNPLSEDCENPEKNAILGFEGSDFCSGRDSECDHVQIDEPPRNGRIRSTCSKCGRFLGYRSDDSAKK